MLSQAQPLRCPMSADDEMIAAAPLGHGVPRHATGRRLFGRALVGKLHPTVPRHDPQASHGVDDDPQSIVAGEALVPAVRLVAVQVTAKPVQILHQRPLDFASQGQRLGDAPLG